MLTDIKSFNYKKVGQKHDEYFGEDAATGFTPNRETGDKTEFINKDSTFGPGGNVNFFKDKNATGFTEFRDTGNPTEYIPGSGNDFNFKNKTNTVDYFLNKNQTGFTHDRFNISGNDIGNTEFIIGSGNDFNFTEKRGFSTFNTTKAYTIDRDTFDETELPDGGGSLYSQSPKLFHLAGGGTDFFANKMIGEGFIVRKDEQLGVSDFYGANTPGYINFNSMQLPKIHIGINYIPNINATGFTTKRTEKDLGPAGGGFAEVEPGGTAGEYIIGSGLLDIDGSPISGPTNFFPNSFGVGFIPNAQDLYNANELNPPGGAGRSMFNLETVVENPGAADGAQEKFQLAIGNVRTARTSVELQAQGSREVPLSSTPNIPFSYQFSDIHPYGEAPNRLALTDRLGEVDEEYKKFGGNAGLRTGNLGFDEPFVIKEIGDGYDTIGWGMVDGLTDIPFKVVRSAEDLIRLGKWTLTAKGIVWNLKQFLLQSQNAMPGTRLFNPAGPLGSTVPLFHLPRHTGGTFIDFQDPPDYNTNFDGLNVKTSDGTTGNMGAPEDEGPPGDIFGDAQYWSNKAKELKRKAENAHDALTAMLAGAPISNRLESLLVSRVEVTKEDEVDTRKKVEKFTAGLLEELGMGNKHFINPRQVVKSTKGPYGADLEQVFDRKEGGIHTKNGNTLITQYTNLQEFKGKKFGQSDVAMVTSNEDYTTVKSTDFNKHSLAKKASTYKLGKGKIKKGTQIYEVGVSNMLQVPYHGQFNKLNSSLADKTKIPDDFVKFRIREAVNGKWLIFPAHLGTITDTTTPEWTKERYIGRPDQTHIYTGASRNVSFDFKVAAFTKQEIPIIQEKMNYLVGLAWPTYKSDDTPVAPYVYLTIGDMFNNTPGYFENITVTVEENAVWEIDDGFQIPQFFNVSLTFAYVGKYLPTTTGKHYEVPWLKDHGAGASSHGTFDKDPRDGSTSRPFIKGTQKWTDSLPVKV